MSSLGRLLTVILISFRRGAGGESCPPPALSLSAIVRVVLGHVSEHLPTRRPAQCAGRLATLWTFGAPLELQSPRNVDMIDVVQARQGRGPRQPGHVETSTRAPALREAATGHQMRSDLAVHADDLAELAAWTQH